MSAFKKDHQYYKFCTYGFLKNLRFFEPFLILFFLEKDITYFQIGILYMLRELTRNIFEIPAGVAADVLGRRRTLISAFSLYIASFILYSISGSMLVLSGATIIFGLGEAFRTGTHKAMIFDYLQRFGWSEQKAHYYGHTRSWSQAGSAISALLAGGLVFYSGKYLNIFLYSAIPYFLGILLIMSYPTWLDGKAESLRSLDIKKTMEETLLNFWHSIRHPRIITGILNVASHGGYYRAIKDYLQPLIVSLSLTLPFFLNLETKRKSALLIGLIYFLIYLMSSAIARRSGKFTGLFGNLVLPLNITLVAGLSAGVFCGLFFTMDLLVLSVVFFVLVYLVENLRLPAGISYLAEQIDPDILATTLSVESQGKSLFTMVLALGMGFLADRFGPGTALLAISLFMLAIVPILRLRDSHRGTIPPGTLLH
ncbi:MFS transporter [Bacteroidota bacterium]